MLRRTLALSVIVLGSIGVAACGSDGGGTPSVDSVVTTGSGVPFDAGVPAGVDTSTDEGGNMGFDPTTPGPVGNQTDPNG